MLCAPSAPSPPGPAPASWEPGQGWPRTQSAGPSPPKSPRVPHKSAVLRGCHQFRLPGPGFDGDFLCGGNKRDVYRVQNTPQVGTSRKGQEVARSQVRAWRSGRNGRSSREGEAYTEAGGADREQAGTQDGAAAGMHPHGPRRDAEEQHAEEESQR